MVLGGYLVPKGTVSVTPGLEAEQYAKLVTTANQKLQTNG